MMFSDRNVHLLFHHYVNVADRRWCLAVDGAASLNAAKSIYGLQQGVRGQDDGERMKVKEMRLTGCSCETVLA